jgi:beta-glucosidase
MEKDILSYKALPENDGKAMPAYGQDHGLSLISLRSTAEKPVSYDDPRWQDLLDQMSFAEQALLITDGQHNTSLVNSVNKPATKDENGPNGVSGSSTKASFPSEGIWASTFNKELLEEVGKCLAEDALAIGITGIYGPGVNLHRAPFGGRAHEYFSEDPYLMAICSVKETIGMQSKGVVTYVKHFVANDEETNRNGVSIWLNEQEMREIVLLPFEYSFRPDMGNAHATMTSFNRIGCLWTSASSALMENVLRDEWGFDGFAITDMASSNAKTFMTYVDGIANGTSLYDGAGSEKALDDYRGNVFFANKMREACHRILYVTANFSAAMNGISASDKIVPIVTWWQATIIGLRVGFGVLAGGTLVMLGVAVFLKRKEIA